MGSSLPGATITRRVIAVLLMSVRFPLSRSGARIFPTRFSGGRPSKAPRSLSPPPAAHSATPTSTATPSSISSTSSISWTPSAAAADIPQSHQSSAPTPRGHCHGAPLVQAQPGPHSPPKTASSTPECMPETRTHDDRRSERNACRIKSRSVTPADAKSACGAVAACPRWGTRSRAAHA